MIRDRPDKKQDFEPGVQVWDGEDGAYENEGYGEAYRSLLVEQVQADGKEAAEKIEQHSHRSNRESMSDLADVAGAAHGVIDAVFGSWSKSSGLVTGVSLLDQFDAGEKQRKEHDKPGDHQNHQTALHRTRYVANNSHHIRELDKRHHADRGVGQARETAELYNERIATVFEKELLDAETALTAGKADAKGNISMDTVERDHSDAAIRSRRWNQFTTLVHELCHRLQHDNYRKFKSRLEKKDPVAHNTYSEGVNEFMTRVALATVNLGDQRLRKQVEGSSYQQSDEPSADVLSRSKYATPFDLANKLVGTIGVNNLYAAYFLGQTDLLGG